MNSYVVNVRDGGNDYRFWLEDTKENGIVLKVNCNKKQTVRITDFDFDVLIFGWDYKKFSNAMKAKEAKLVATKVAKNHGLPTFAVDYLVKYVLFLDKTKEISAERSKVWGKRGKCEIDVIANAVIGAKA